MDTPDRIPPPPPPAGETTGGEGEQPINDRDGYHCLACKAPLAHCRVAHFTRTPAGVSWQAAYACSLGCGTLYLQCFYSLIYREVIVLRRHWQSTQWQYIWTLRSNA